LSQINSTGKNLLSFIIDRIFFKKHYKIDDNEASFIK